MTGKNRRSFIGLLTTGLASLRAPWARAEGQAADRKRRLAAALRELNDAAGIGITPDEMDRARDYATGALLEAEARLRTVALDDSLDLPIHFSARRGGR